jgi:hypothetical protein
MSSGTELFQAMLTQGKKFNGGALMVSKGVDNPFKDNVMVAKFVILSLTRHLLGDWGDVGSAGIEANEQSIQMGRLVSIYNVPKDLRNFAKIPVEVGDLVIVTEAGHKETLVLWYGEYESSDKKLRHN